MIVIDTNVLLYAVNSDSPFYERARAAIAEYTAGEFSITLGIAYEFMRVATHHKVFPNPLSAQKASKFISVLTSDQNCYVLLPTKNHFSLVDSIVSKYSALAGNLFHNLATVALMLENGIKRILTNDKDFLQFEEIEVIKLF